MSVYFYGCVTLDGYLADQNHGMERLDQTGGAQLCFHTCESIAVQGICARQRRCGQLAEPRRSGL